MSHGYETIFLTSYTSHGKVCNVIIDSGSCTNVVAKEMVTKLNLTIKPLLQPYKIQLFQRGNGLKVTKRCLVSFSIGKNYKDEVWCDAMPMDACHLLLRRPWQYDQNVSHYRFKNTHSFVKDGGRIVLTPLMPKVKDSKVVGNYFLTGSQLKKVLTKQDEIYALLVMDAYSTQQAPCHELFLPLLEEFKDMIPDEILIGLPPMRNIQHCIDLVPRATLPNKVVYRMNSFQQAELQKLVDHLIAKGLIRESMNPCTIPTLLVLKKDGSWRMCIDSRAINKITIKYQFPILRLDDLLDQLYSAKVFCKIDL